MRYFGGLSAAVLALALGIGSTSAHAATVLVSGSGWQEGVDNGINSNQANAPITFTVGSTPQLFSLSDGYITGDVFKILISGSLTSTLNTTFSSYSTPFNNNLGPFASEYASDWLSNRYSHAQIQLGAGTYSILVQDTSSIQYPAHFGFRLDAAAVPEPATWIMMLLGFAGLSYILRRRQRVPARTQFA